MGLVYSIRHREPFWVQRIMKKDVNILENIVKKNVLPVRIPVATGSFGREVSCNIHPSRSKTF